MKDIFRGLSPQIFKIVQNRGVANTPRLLTNQLPPPCKHSTESLQTYASAHRLRSKFCSVLHSAQPDMFWRTHHTKSDPKSMRVMPLCLRGVYTRLD